MKLQELLDCDGDYDYAIYCFWGIEMFLATSSGCSYSDLELVWDESRRTCKICGEIGGTDEFGGIVDKCPNPQCQLVRDFFRIESFPDAARFNCGGRETDGNRYEYLRRRLVKAGYNKLSKIPRDIFFTFLVSAMLERISHEANN